MVQVSIQTDAIQELLELVGAGRTVDMRPAERKEYEQATFPTHCKIPLIVRPENKEQVQCIVQWANRWQIHLYPLSRGFNWGLGSKVPTTDGAVVMDLSKMDRIMSFDEEFGSLTVQPGVTFRQVSEYLHVRSSERFLAVIGGHPDSSVIGNTLERGDGLGPFGDRSHYCCSFEIVLATGEIVRSGMNNFDEGSISKLVRDSLGPSIDGLFLQSNFGIITEMTFWLRRKPKHFGMVIFPVKQNADVTPLINAIRSLQEDGVLLDNSFALWNVFKLVAAFQQHPQASALSARAVWQGDARAALLATLPDPLKEVRWLANIAVYSPSSSHARSSYKAIRNRLGIASRDLLVLDSKHRWARHFAARKLSRLLGIDARRWVDTLIERSAFLGCPTETSVRSVYWRKPMKIPNTIDPNRDRCGLLWLCHVLPFSGQAVGTIEEITEKAAWSHGIEPNLALFNHSERALRAFIALIYDRDSPGADHTALSCQRLLQHQLHQAGFPPFRVGIQAFSDFQPSDLEYRKLLKKLKHLFDPQDVLSPGRYDFRHAWE